MKYLQMSILEDILANILEDVLEENTDWNSNAWDRD